jgi:hypothetical protein
MWKCIISSLKSETNLLSNVTNTTRLRYLEPLSSRSGIVQPRMSRNVLLVEELKNYIVGRYALDEIDIYNLTFVSSF